VRSYSGEILFRVDQAVLRLHSCPLSISISSQWHLFQPARQEGERKIERERERKRERERETERERERERTSFLAN